MNKRKILSLLVSSLFTCLLLVFGWAYFYGLTSNPTEMSVSEKEKINDLFKGVPVGGVDLQRLKNTPVWIVHLSSKQRSQVKSLNESVIDQEVGCDLDRVYCVLSAETNRDGVYLQFIQHEPPKLTTNTPWYGGFVDPASGAIYDLIGRAYKQNKDQSIDSMKRININ